MGDGDDGGGGGKRVPSHDDGEKGALKPNEKVGADNSHHHSPCVSGWVCQEGQKIRLTLGIWLPKTRHLHPHHLGWNPNQMG